jgi:diadenosine tetraphosphatase ApaH/serine/threonine PP2A family protein phosphatase
MLSYWGHVIFMHMSPRTSPLGSISQGQVHDLSEEVDFSFFLHFDVLILWTDSETVTVVFMRARFWCRSPRFARILEQLTL